MTIGVIPARFKSTRFPGKPLALIGNKPMIQHVYEKVIQSQNLDYVVVATDDKRIFETVEGFGGKAIYTDENHPSGTDRIAEVSKKLPEYEILINIQGDEPFINSSQIDTLISSFQNPSVQIATLIQLIDSQDELISFTTPKVIIDKQGFAIYFSRNIIPHLRNVEINDYLQNHNFFKHIGIYGYRREILLEISQLSTSYLENAESLEQLRWIENGYKIHTQKTNHIAIAVDTPEDLIKAEKYYEIVKNEK